MRIASHTAGLIVLIFCVNSHEWSSSILRSYIFVVYMLAIARQVYMLAIARETAGPNGLNILREPILYFLSYVTMRKHWINKF